MRISDWSSDVCSSDRPLTGTDNNAADVMRATDFILPAIEIVDTRYTGYGTNLLVDSVADAASCGLVVLGSRPMRHTELDLRARQCVVSGQSLSVRVALVGRRIIKQTLPTKSQT